MVVKKLIILLFLFLYSSFQLSSNRVAIEKPISDSHGFTKITPAQQIIFTFPHNEKMDVGTKFLKKYPECDFSNQIQIEKNVKAFQWAESGKEILYSNDTELKRWEVYSIATKQKEEAGDEEITTIKVSEPKPPKTDYSLELQSNPYLIQLDQTRDSLTVKLRKTGEDRILLQKKVTGELDKYSWVGTERYFVFSVKWNSAINPAGGYIYGLDKDTLNFQVLIPVSKENSNTTLIDFVPGTESFLFTNTNHFQGDTDLIELFDVSSKSVKKTSLPIIFYTRWINDEKLMLGYGRKPEQRGENDGYFIFNYDLANDKVDYLNEKGINAYPWMENSIQISPDLNGIGYIENESKDLILILCSV